MSQTGRLCTPELSMMDGASCDTIHHASLEILRRTGVRVFHDEALALLRDAGAIARDGNLVRIPAALVEWALKQVPPSIVLCRRGSSQGTVRLEGREVNFGTGSDCPHYLDPRTTEHRPYRLSDVVDSIKLVDALPEIDFTMSMGVPSDLGQANPYRRQFALMIKHTTKPNVFVCDDRADCEAIVAMAAAAAGGEDELRLNPTLLLYSEPSTPLKHSETATGKLLCMAEKALPIVHSPAPMMGGTAPVTIAGALALGNAELLSSLVMHQLKRPGAPFVYGVQVHHMDMKTTISVYGAPEYQMVRTMTAELGRYYNMPTWGNAGMTDSCSLDQQAGIDAAFSVMVALMTGTNLTHDVGYMEAGLTTSPEMIVMTAEVIALMRRYAAGVRLDAETLALEVIDRVGPGGDFLTQKHTLEHFRDLWQPTIFSRDRLDNWLQAGGKDYGARLRERTVAIMDEHEPEPLPDSLSQEIDYILQSN